MTERSATPATPATSGAGVVPEPRTGSVVPARLRITAWILLTAALGLLAVVLTVRSALLTDVEQSANDAVSQEVDEFRTFTERGRDPATGAPFGSAERLLPLYLERQFPDDREVLLGWDADAARAGRPALLVQAAQDPTGLSGDPALVRRLVEDPRGSGIAEVGDRDIRWGAVRVQGTGTGGGGAFLVAVDIGAGRDDVADVMELVLLVSVGGLVLVAAIAFVVAGQILAPVRVAGRVVTAVSRDRTDRRIPVRGRDDVATLGLAVNALLDRFADGAREQRDAVRAVRERLPAADRQQTIALLDDLELLASSQSPGCHRPRTLDPVRLGALLAADVPARGPRWSVDGSCAPDAGGPAVADPDLLRAALARLCANAEARDPSGAALRASWRVHDAGAGRVLEIEVADGAPPPDDPASAFAVPPAGAGAPGAAVLAPVVVRVVADLHDGSATVTPRPSGTAFGLVVPLPGPSSPESAG